MLLLWKRSGTMEDKVTNYKKQYLLSQFKILTNETLLSVKRSSNSTSLRASAAETIGACLIISMYECASREHWWLLRNKSLKRNVENQVTLYQMKRITDPSISYTTLLEISRPEQIFHWQFVADKAYLFWHYTGSPWRRRFHDFWFPYMI
jgi:hypothetical protein